MRLEASLMLEPVFTRDCLLPVVSRWAGAGSQVRVSKAWCDTIVAMAMEVNAMK